VPDLFTPLIFEDCSAARMSNKGGALAMVGSHVDAPPFKVLEKLFLHKLRAPVRNGADW